MRVVLHEREEAVSVAARLRAAGWEAAVARERLAGEDDEEGHPWAVLTDAPGALVELLAEEYDGWVDSDETPAPPAPPAPPMRLPDGPLRGRSPGGNGTVRRPT